jgi:hypothetical protein
MRSLVETVPPNEGGGVKVGCVDWTAESQMS